MERELDLISFKGFATYFLLVQDIVQALKHQDIPSRICGRGSGAASLVSYALGLSNVDPVGTNLMFERFLTVERKDPPDMDIDLAWDERDRVIQVVFERYGRDRVAMVANHTFFKSKGALRSRGPSPRTPRQRVEAARSLRPRVGGWSGVGSEEPSLGGHSPAGSSLEGPLPSVLGASGRDDRDHRPPLGARGLSTGPGQGEHLDHRLGQGRG